MENFYKAIDASRFSDSWEMLRTGNVPVGYVYQALSRVVSEITTSYRVDLHSRKSIPLAVTKKLHWLVKAIEETNDQSYQASLVNLVNARTTDVVECAIICSDKLLRLCFQQVEPLKLKEAVGSAIPQNDIQSCKRRGYNLCRLLRVALENTADNVDLKPKIIADDKTIRIDTIGAVGKFGKVGNVGDIDVGDCLQYWEEFILLRLISADSGTTNLLTLQSLLWYFASLSHARRQKLLSSKPEFSFLLKSRPMAYLSSRGSEKFKLIYSYGIYTTLFLCPLLYSKITDLRMIVKDHLICCDNLFLIWCPATRSFPFGPGNLRPKSLSTPCPNEPCGLSVPLFAAHQCTCTSDICINDDETSTRKDGNESKSNDDDENCRSSGGNLTGSCHSGGGTRQINLELMVSIYFMDLDLSTQTDYYIFDKWFRTYCDGVKSIILSVPDTRDTMTLITSYV